MKIGLVLSGGMVRGALQIGALKAIREYLAPSEIEVFSCASIGALNGYAFATDRLKELEALWLGVCADNSRLFIKRAVKCSLFQNTVDRLYVPGDKLPGEFYIPLLNFKEKAVEYTNISAVPSEMYPTYLRAGVSMPIYSKSIQIGSSFYNDGAFVDNTPIFPLYEKSLDYILCIYFDDCNTSFENEAFDRKVVKLPLPLKKLFTETFVLNKAEVTEMIARGYDATKQTLEIVFKNGTQDVDFIRSVSALLDKGEPKNYRVTGDIVVRNLYKVTKQIAKRKVLL